MPTKKTQRTPEEEKLIAERSRLREEVRRIGPEEIGDAELLSALLSYTLPLCDYRSVAERMLKYFGGIKGIFDAPEDQLEKAFGLPMHTALTLKCVPTLCRRLEYEAMPQKMQIKTPFDAERWLFPRFFGYDNERAVLLLLNKQSRPMDVILIGDGGKREVYIDRRKIARAAVINSSKNVILAHSHPNGAARPSENDIIVTMQLAKDLAVLDVTLWDHLIFSRGSCYYMSTTLDRSYLAFSDIEPKTDWRKALEYDAGFDIPDPFPEENGADPADG